MKKLLKWTIACAAAAGLGLTTAASGSSALMVSGNHTDGTRAVALFDPFSGALLDSNFINIGTTGVQKHALQVGNEIWVSEQAAGIVRRYSLTGNFLGQITDAAPGQGLSNIRGMGIVNGSVYVTHAGTTGGAAGNAVIQYDFNGNWLGNHAVESSPFSVLDYNGSMLIGHQSGSLDIQAYDYDINHLGPFHTGPVSWVQQISVNAAGNILATGWSSNGLYEIDSDGNLLNTISADSARGVWELGNGNIMWTNSNGVHVYDVNSGTHNTVLGAFNGQYIDLLTVPAPGAIALLGLTGLVGSRRRR